ncbi:uncharacterized protein LOC119738463 [Patiria miniata]|uniref:Uncharacterized protein n=1 Tax=Patiria miniata TaxID=46514 RepID=A0A914B1B8_PATMI|nr:uncharacterized protein LOC119738463 [Patiria miniata]
MPWTTKQTSRNSEKIPWTDEAKNTGKRSGRDRYRLDTGPVLRRRSETRVAALGPMTRWAVMVWVCCEMAGPTQADAAPTTPTGDVSSTSQPEGATNPSNYTEDRYNKAFFTMLLVLLVPLIAYVTAIMIKIVCPVDKDPSTWCGRGRGTHPRIGPDSAGGEDETDKTWGEERRLRNAVFMLFSLDKTEEEEREEEQESQQIEAAMRRLQARRMSMAARQRSRDDILGVNGRSAKTDSLLGLLPGTAERILEGDAEDLGDSDDRRQEGGTGEDTTSEKPSKSEDDTDENGDVVKSNPNAVLEVNGCCAHSTNSSQENPTATGQTIVVVKREDTRAEKTPDYVEGVTHKQQRANIDADRVNMDDTNTGESAADDSVKPALPEMSSTFAHHDSCSNVGEITGSKQELNKHVCCPGAKNVDEAEVKTSATTNVLLFSRRPNRSSTDVDNCVESASKQPHEKVSEGPSCPDLKQSLDGSFNSSSNVDPTTVNAKQSQGRANENVSCLDLEEPNVPLENHPSASVTFDSLADDDDDDDDIPTCSEIKQDSGESLKRYCNVVTKVNNDSKPPQERTAKKSSCLDAKEQDPNARPLQDNSRAGIINYCNADVCHENKLADADEYSIGSDRRTDHSDAMSTEQSSHGNADLQSWGSYGELAISRQPPGTAPPRNDNHDDRSSVASPGEQSSSPGSQQALLGDRRSSPASLKGSLEIIRI